MIFAAIAGGLLLAAILLVTFQEYLILPSLRFPPRTGPLPSGIVEHFLSSDDGVKIRAWIVEPNPGGPLFGRSMLMFHGNGDLVSSSAGVLASFAQEGLRGYVMDYRGTGGNPGWPTTENLLKDAEQLFRFAESQHGTGSVQAVLGTSFGTGLATPIAARFDIPVLLLVSPHLSIADVVMDRGPLALLSPFVRLNIGSKQAFPLLKNSSVVIAHGARDTTILPRHGEALSTLYRGNKSARLILVPEAGHGDTLTRTMRELLDTLTQA